MSSFVNDPFFASTSGFSDPFLGKRSLLVSGLPVSSGMSLTGTLVFKINVDVLDGSKEYIVMAELPGVPKDKVDVMIENNILTIKAEKILKSVHTSKVFTYRLIVSFVVFPARTFFQRTSSTT